MQRKGISIQLNNGAKQYLLEHGYDAKNGVRPLRRLIQDTIEDHLALDMLDEKYAKGDIIQVAAKTASLTMPPPPNKQRQYPPTPNRQDGSIIGLGLLSCCWPLVLVVANRQALLTGGACAAISRRPLSASWPTRTP